MTVIIMKYLQWVVPRVLVFCIEGALVGLSLIYCYIFAPFRRFNTCNSF
jgi:hypothetical protein